MQAWPQKKIAPQDDFTLENPKVKGGLARAKSLTKEERAAIAKKASVWVRMYHYYNLRRDEFLTHYHRRSNVETVFSMIKSKFGAQMRCKTPVAQMNEALCKVLAHNLCCVIQSVYELNINASFRTENAPVRKVG